MAQYLDLEGTKALWEKVKKRIESGVGTIDLTPYLKIANVATINGKKLTEGGDITIDLTLFKVVSTLPTLYGQIDPTKIYLVKSATSGTDNIYTEYICTGETTDSSGGSKPQWEKLGEYKSEVDLTPYAKTADVNTALATKVDKVSGKQLSTEDYTTEEKTKLGKYNDTPLFVPGSGNNSIVSKTTTGYCSANGGSAIAMVNGTADGTYSIAMGVASRAKKNYSVAIGCDVSTNTIGGIALGQANIASVHSALSVGAGYSANAQGMGDSTYVSALEIYTDASYSGAGSKNGYLYLVGLGGFNGTNFEVSNALNPDIKSVQEVINEAVTKLDGVAASATADSAIPVATIEALS